MSRKTAFNRKKRRMVRGKPAFDSGGMFSPTAATSGSAATSNSTTTLDPGGAYSPLMEDVLQGARGLAGRQYTPYDESKRFAGFTGDQQVAQQGVRDMQNVYQGNYANAQGAIDSATAQAGGVGTAGATAFGKAGAGPGGMGAAQPFLNQASKSWTDPGTADAWMNPYTKNVTDATVQQAQTAFSGPGGILQGLQNTFTGGGAAQFGRERMGDVAGKLTTDWSRGLGQSLGAINASGYNQGMTAFGNEQQRQAGLAGTAGQLGIGDINAQTGLGTAQGNQALQGVQAGIQAGTAQQGLGTARQTAGYTDLNALNASGAQQQALEQKQKDFAYQQNREQVNWPVANLQAMQGLGQGWALPTTASSSSSTTGYSTPAQGSAAGQIAGAGLAAAGIASSFFGGPSSADAGIPGSNQAAVNAANTYGSAPAPQNQARGGSIRGRPAFGPGGVVPVTRGIRQRVQARMPAMMQRLQAAQGQPPGMMPQGPPGMAAGRPPPGPPGGRPAFAEGGSTDDFFIPAVTPGGKRSASAEAELLRPPSQPVMAAGPSAFGSPGGSADGATGNTGGVGGGGVGGSGGVGGNAGVSGEGADSGTGGTYARGGRTGYAGGSLVGSGDFGSGTGLPFISMAKDAYGIGKEFSDGDQGLTPIADTPYDPAGGLWHMLSGAKQATNTEAGRRGAAIGAEVGDVASMIFPLAAPLFREGFQRAGSGLGEMFGGDFNKGIQNFAAGTPFELVFHGARGGRPAFADGGDVDQAMRDEVGLGDSMFLRGQQAGPAIKSGEEDLNPHDRANRRFYEGLARDGMGGKPAFMTGLADTMFPGVADELRGGVAALAHPESSYDNELALARAKQRVAEEEHPGAYYGGMGTGMGASIGAFGGIQKALQAMPWFARLSPLRQAMVAGAAQGAPAGFAGGEGGFWPRVVSGAIGSGIGAPIGAGMHVGAKYGPQVYRALRSAFGG